MMIVIMQPGASVAQIGAVLRACQERELRPVPSHGTERTVIGAFRAAIVALRKSWPPAARKTWWARAEWLSIVIGAKDSS